MSYKFKTKLVVMLTASLFFIGFVCSMITWSSFELTVKHLYQFYFSFDLSSMEQQIIGTLRAPRVYSAMLIGANLAVAGLLMQKLTSNALASPSILGLNAGAACFMALSSVGFPVLSSLPTIAVAAFGAVSSGFLVLLLGGFFSKKPLPLKLVLAGIAINALLVGLTRASVILADDMAYSVIQWLAGSVSSINAQQWHKLWPISVVGLALALFNARSLNLFSLGSDVAISLGINVKRTQLLTCVAIILLTASSVSIAGPIAFVGLIVPHIAAPLIGQNLHVSIPFNALLGATLLSWSDTISRGVAFPAETPVGVITALIGTPIFIFLAARNKKI
ncbi:iron chelate uptake ABC transporter family permease subunit [Vibrio tapetis subsp. quintayensis]|uniref:FecCD family ABC transporter permease n=1 Tax=Vibrio tapetis TaxID=52443 RepID=UPI0025B5B5BD|nr:iron chelate uptake ABC transporter family permease subunit [Vibrio tapetis]MDN3681255.1 iron chelate uptake ABC transporter family permease subunit [Vibrio tapetis subsp. quintayensis]